MSNPSRVRMTGPLTPYAEGFAAELARQGYDLTQQLWTPI